MSKEQLPALTIDGLEDFFKTHFGDWELKSVSDEPCALVQTKDGTDLNTIMKTIENAPRLFDSDIQSIKGFVTLFHEEMYQGDYGSSEGTFVGYLDNVALLAEYSLPSYCDDECDARLTIKIVSGDQNQVVEIARQWANDNFELLLKYKVGDLSSLLLRQQNKFGVFGSANIIASAFALNQRQLSIDNHQTNVHAIQYCNGIYQIVQQLKEVNISNSLNLLCVMAPNLKSIKYDYDSEYDDEGGSYKNVTGHTLITYDDKEIAFSSDDVMDDTETFIDAISENEGFEVDENNHDSEAVENELLDKLRVQLGAVSIEAVRDIYSVIRDVCYETEDFEIHLPENTLIPSKEVSEVA